MVMQNMCFISTNKKPLYVNNKHATKQLVNSENWSLYTNVLLILSFSPI